MKMHLCRGLFALIFSVCIISGCQEDGQGITPEENFQMSDDALEAFELINAHRKNKGLAPLIHHSSVYDVAKEHSQNMADGSVDFGHDGFSDRVNSLKSNLSLKKSGENVAYTTRENPASYIVDMWIESKGHRNNIENPSFTHTGMAMVKSENGRHYFTQFFIQLNKESGE